MEKHQDSDLSDVSPTLLRDIDTIASFMGIITPSIVVEQLAMPNELAAKAITEYSLIMAEGLTHDQSSGEYRVNETCFTPRFSDQGIHAAIARLREPLTQRLIGFETVDFGRASVEPQTPLQLQRLATICRAIHQAYEATITLNGHGSLVIHPHAVFDCAHCWYIRAYRADSGGFTDIRLRDIQSAKVLKTTRPPVAQAINDTDWSRNLTLEIAPHPNAQNVSCAKTIPMDFDLVDGKMTIVKNAVTAGYWLRDWNIDYTENFQQVGQQYQFALLNSASLIPLMADHPDKMRK